MLIRMMVADLAPGVEPVTARGAIVAPAMSELVAVYLDGDSIVLDVEVNSEELQRMLLTQARSDMSTTARPRLSRWERTREAVAQLRGEALRIFRS